VNKTRESKGGSRKKKGGKISRKFPDFEGNWGFLRLFFGGMLVFGVKMGFGGLICRVWANQVRKKRSKTFENIRKVG